MSQPPVTPGPDQPAYDPLAGQTYLPPQNPATPQPAPRRRARWPWITGAAVALAALAALVTWMVLPSEGEEAAERCQEQIESRLKAPATAQWSEIEIEDRGNGHWFISGQVDAENGFGALVRNSWSCEMYTEDRKKWTSNAVKLG